MFRQQRIHYHYISAKNSSTENMPLVYVSQKILVKMTPFTIRIQEMVNDINNDSYSNKTVLYLWIRIILEGNPSHGGYILDIGPYGNKMLIIISDTVFYRKTFIKLWWLFRNYQLNDHVHQVRAESLDNSVLILRLE